MNQIPSTNNIPVAMDLRDFYISTEWDVMAVPAVRNEKFYTCCEVRLYKLKLGFKSLKISVKSTFVVDFYPYTFFEYF